MAKEVVWTKIILETFLEESGILDRIELGEGRYSSEQRGKSAKFVFGGLNPSTTSKSFIIVFLTIFLCFLTKIKNNVIISNMR